MVISFSGAAICHVILATYIYLSTATDVNVSEFNWVPIVSFSGMLLIAGCGAIPVPYVIIAEILPDKVSVQAPDEICKIMNHSILMTNLLKSFIQYLDP